MTDKIKNNILGLAVGDAFGVPYEFMSREKVKSAISDKMTGFGTHNQPAGTWSDDTSLTLCLMDGLDKGFNLEIIMANFLRWFEKGEYTAGNVTFDVGIATHKAIMNFKSGKEPILCGGADEFSNGNGSLMRISPLAFYLINKDIDERRRLCFQVSSLTHAHNRSKIACWLMVEILINILLGKNKEKSVDNAFELLGNWVQSCGLEEEWQKFNRCRSTIKNLNENSIKSSGYVIDTLEAAIWSFLSTDSYKESIITAVSLGDDTDTTAAVTGSISGLYYGLENIPVDWLGELKAKDLIVEIINRFAENLSKST